MVLYLLPILVTLHIRLCFSLSPILGHVNSTTETSNDNTTTNRIQTFEEIVYAGICRIHRDYPWAFPLQIIALASLSTRSASPLDFDSYTIYSSTNTGIGPYVRAEKPSQRTNWRGPVIADPPTIAQTMSRPFEYDREGYPIKLQQAFAFVAAAGFGNLWEAVHFLRVSDQIASERWDQHHGHVYGFTQNRGPSPAMRDFVFVSAFSGNVLDWTQNPGGGQFSNNSSTPETS